MAAKALANMPLTKYLKISKSEINYVKNYSARKNTIIVSKIKKKKKQKKK